jgi:hypothetical protein
MLGQHGDRFTRALATSPAPDVQHPVPQFADLGQRERRRSRWPLGHELDQFHRNPCRAGHHSQRRPVVAAATRRGDDPDSVCADWIVGQRLLQRDEGALVSLYGLNRGWFWPAVAVGDGVEMEGHRGGLLYEHMTNKGVLGHCRSRGSYHIDGYAVANCSFENGRGDDLIVATPRGCMPPPEWFVGKRLMDVGSYDPAVIGD